MLVYRYIIKFKPVIFLTLCPKPYFLLFYTVRAVINPERKKLLENF